MPRRLFLLGTTHVSDVLNRPLVFFHYFDCVIPFWTLFALYLLSVFCYLIISDLMLLDFNCLAFLHLLYMYFWRLFVLLTFAWIQNYSILANLDIDQKISTTGNQFTSQPATTERRKTGKVYFFRLYFVSVGLYKSCWFMFISMVLDSTFVSSSFMASKFEIPTSTSPTILSTGNNLVSIKIHFI